MRTRVLTTFTATLLSACAVGPNYHRPDVETPTAFKEAQAWAPATPQAMSQPAAWWEVFGDTQLNALAAQVAVSNQSLLAAIAQYREATAVTREAVAGLFPTIGVNASLTRSRSTIVNSTTTGNTTTGTTTGGTTTGGTTTGTTTTGTTTTAVTNNAALIRNEYSVTGQASWELDAWGKVRRTIEQNRATANATEEDMLALQLSEQATLAQDYLLLRVADRNTALLQQTVDEYQRSLKITQNRFDVGVAARLDVVQAQSQLKSAQAQLIDIGVQRAQLEHAIAILIGKAPAGFSIAPQSDLPEPPQIPGAVPSELLQHRPDIAAAERRMAAANAGIGVAQAAFFPSLTLSGSAGYQGSNWSGLFDVPNRIWSFGPALAETLFDGGLRRAQKAAARAAYDASVANYRQVVLTAFGEAEDNLSSLRILAQEATVQEDAVNAAREAVNLTLNQYRAGTVSYLDVVTVQATLLAAQRTAVTLSGERLTASVALLKALGGPWAVAAGSG